MTLTSAAVSRCLIAAAIIAAPSAAQAATAFDYNVVAFENFTSSNTEVNGALAVGQNATLANFGVGVQLDSSYKGGSLVVGNNLSYTNGQVFHGDALVGGAINSSGFNVAGGTAKANAALPIDFAAEFVRLKDLSKDLTALESNGTINKTWQLEFTGTDAAVNVFDLTSALLETSGGFAINIPTGSIAIINVSGSSFAANSNGSFTLNGQTIVNQTSALASSVLFNFTEASTMKFNGSWAGNILAPTADVSLNYGGFYGSLQAKNIISNAEFYHVNFDESRLPPMSTPPVNIPPIPEPATWTLLIGGFVFVGVMMRRRKTVVSFS